MPFSGRTLQDLRKKNGLSQSQLAEKAGISKGVLQSWEIDRRKPKTDSLLALARALDVPLEVLLGGVDGRKPKKRK